MTPVAEPIREMALSPLPSNDPALLMIERMVADPAVDVSKLQALMDMRNRELARVSEQAFNAAMSLAQKDMRPVAANAENPQTRSRYANYAQLDRALRPVYTAHDFALSFDTVDSPLEGHIRLVCYVTHAAGFARTYRADMPADGKGAKGGDVMTKTHATGSAMSYGMRYLLKMIFNVAVGEGDDDGNKAGQKDAQAAPDDYADWLAHMEDVVAKGCTRKELDAAWYASAEDLRKHVTLTEKGKVDGWIAASNAVTVKQKAAK